MDYINLFKSLHQENVKYLICGGLAVNIYGIPRMTSDIDLLLEFSQENIDRFNKATSSLHFQPRLPIKLENLIDEDVRKSYIEDKNLIAFSYYNTKAQYMTLDILIDVPITFDELWSQKETRIVDNYSLYVTSIEHLIALKRYANRIQDRQDVLLLKKIKNNFF